MQLQSKNDIRPVRVGAPQRLTDEAQTIARITGYQPTSQFFLIARDQSAGVAGASGHETGCLQQQGQRIDKRSYLGHSI